MGIIYSDIPELEGTDTDVALSNLRDLEKELGDVLEKRIAHLCELANAILKDGGDIDVIKSIILSIRSDGDIYPINAIDENQKELRAALSGISVIERLMIFRQVFTDRAMGDIPLHPSSNAHHNSNAKIAYVRNSYNDTAFGYFASLFDQARASYYDTVSDVCDSVSSGNSQFCILPIETGRDGRLLTFYNLMLEHDLRINAEYDIKSSEGDTYTRYALLSNEVASVTQMKRIRNATRFLEITYTDTDNLAVKELLAAAEYCGLEICSLDTVFRGNSVKDRTIDVVFSAGGADIKTFTSFLSVDCPDHTVIGYYQRG